MPSDNTKEHSRWNDLQLFLEEQLRDIRNEEPQFLPYAKRAMAICQQSVIRLQETVARQPFRTSAEEVIYYKQVKPFFVGRVVFYSTAFDIELARPSGGKKETKRYLRSRLKQVRKIFSQNWFIYQYLRSGETYLDDRLFVPPGGDSPVTVYSLDIPSEFAFPLGFDRVVSRIRAAELLETHLEAQIEELLRPGLAGTQSAPHVTWTDSKTGLIELAYALQSAGVLNNGKIDLKEIIDFLSAAFNIQLGNYPRTFQEILARKTGYTTLIDKLRDKLLLRIQRIEDKYER